MTVLLAKKKAMLDVLVLFYRTTVQIQSRNFQMVCRTSHFSVL